MAPHVPPPAIVSLNLGLALVATSNAPLLLLKKDLAIIAASKSFCRAFQIDPSKVEGCLLSELSAGEWDKPQLNSMLHATASGYAEIEGYEIDLEREGRSDRRLALNAQKLSYSGGRGRPACLVGNRYHRSPPGRETAGRPCAGKGHPASGAASPGRQQPSDHRKRADAECAQGPVR